MARALGDANNMRPLNWGAQTEKIRNASPIHGPHCPFCPLSRVVSPQFTLPTPRERVEVSDRKKTRRLARVCA